MEQPEKLAQRPQYKGYPITFVSYVDAKGVPDFKITVEERRVEVASRRLCALCGEPLDYYIAFIGYQESVDSRLFGDGPMHRDCAEYAFEVCPFLAAQSDYATHHKTPGKKVGKEPQDKTQMALYLTRGFKTKFDPNGSRLLFKAEKAVTVTWKEREPAT